MANSEEKSQIRPTLPLRLNNSTSLNSGCGLSPVTDLMFNLSGLSTNSIVETPKKRISWSNLTPNCSLSSKDSDQSFSESPQTDTLVSSNRLLKNVNPQNESTQIIRRVRTFPFHPNPLRDKENIPNCILTDHTSRKLKCLGSSTSDSNNSIELHDSGYSTVQTDLEESNSVIDKSNLLLQRLNYENESKSVNEIKDCLNMPSPSGSQSTIVRSTLFVNEDGDDFLDVFGIDKQNENLDFSVNITNLLTKPVIHSLSEDTIFGENSVKQKNVDEKKIRPGIRRCLSLISECDFKIAKSEFDSLVQWKKHGSSYDNINDPQNSQINNKSIDSNNNNNGCVVNEMKPAFKRPDPPKDFSCPIQSKRRKSVPLVPLLTNDSRLLSSKKSPLQRCHSETEATIMKALQRSVQEPDLIGDFSKPFALPLVKGKHQDVKTISATTVMDLLKGKYKHIVDSFTVVDCRYPYEFEGGHIRDAKNIYTKEGIIEYFLSNKNKFSQDKRNVIIFHCEFSSERGPTLYRFLRNMDRETNKDRYPLLHHPELYVLHGGYKAFYENFKEYCEPQEYKPMLHKEHEQELRQFKAKSKSWNGDCKARMGIRPGLKF